MNSPRIKENDVPCFALHKFAFTHKRIIFSEFQPVRFAVLGPRVSLHQRFLSYVVVGIWYHLETSDAVCPNVNEGYHSLNTMKPFFVGGVLVSVKIFDERVPALIGGLVPPWSPADESVEACDQLRGVPDSAEDLFDIGVCAQVPRGFGMAAAVRDKEANRAATGPVLIVPGFGVIPFDATSQSFKPLP